MHESWSLKHQNWWKAQIRYWKPRPKVKILNCWKKRPNPQPKHISAQTLKTRPGNQRSMARRIKLKRLTRWPHPSEREGMGIPETCEKWSGLISPELRPAAAVSFPCFLAPRLCPGPSSLLRWSCRRKSSPWEGPLFLNWARDIANSQIEGP